MDLRKYHCFGFKGEIGDDCITYVQGMIYVLGDRIYFFQNKRFGATPGNEIVKSFGFSGSWWTTKTDYFKDRKFELLPIIY